MVPNRPADLSRRFQQTRLESNNNKWWKIEYWDKEGVARRTFARVGDECSRPTIDQGVTLSFVEGHIRDKTRMKSDGSQYVEVKQQLVEVKRDDSNRPFDSRVSARLDKILRAANDNIATYLNRAIGEMSLEQVELGRLALQQVVKAKTDAELIRAAQDYYNAIPTILGRKIDPLGVASGLKNSADTEEDRLQQLKVAIESNQTVQEGGSVWDTIGARLSYVEDESEWKRVSDFILNTRKHSEYSRLKVEELFTVEIKADREAWDSKPEYGAESIELFHGTRPEFVRHILRTGLIVPQVASNGRAFGDGIYFANVSTKSLNYAIGGDDRLSYLFIADVRQGKYHVPRNTYSGRQAPTGYDTLWAKGGESGRLIHDEIIVFNRERQRIKYLAMCRS